MTVTVSLALVFAIAVAALLKFKVVGIGAAVACLLLGFYLADTDMADDINDTVTSIADTLSDIG